MLSLKMVGGGRLLLWPSDITSIMELKEGHLLVSFLVNKEERKIEASDSYDVIHKRITRLLKISLGENEDSSEEN